MSVVEDESTNCRRLLTKKKRNSSNKSPFLTSLTWNTKRDKSVSDLSESDWVRQAAAGDRAAFARLVDRYWDAVRRWLFGLTGKEHAAEDIAQETFLKAWTALPNLRETGAFRVWLFQIARRCWVDAKRRSGAHLKLPLPADVADKQAGPLGELLEVETQQQLQLALASLPSQFRAAVSAVDARRAAVRGDRADPRRQ